MKCFSLIRCFFYYCLTYFYSYQWVRWFILQIHSYEHFIKITIDITNSHLIFSFNIPNQNFFCNFLLIPRHFCSHIYAFQNSLREHFCCHNEPRSVFIQGHIIYDLHIFQLTSFCLPLTRKNCWINFKSIRYRAGFLKFLSAQ